MDISLKIIEYSSLESKLEHFAPPRQECEVLRWACLYVCLSVCMSVRCLQNDMFKLREIFCTC